MSEQRYKAVLAVISDGRSVTEVANAWRVSRQTLGSQRVVTSSRSLGEARQPGPQFDSGRAFLAAQEVAGGVSALFQRG